MLYRRTKMTVVGCSLAAVLLLLPAESEGGLLDCLCPWRWCGRTTPPPTSCAPPYVTQRVSLMPVAPCSPCSQAYYLTPKSTRRWSFSRMNVTRYRPVTTVDPCTGCAGTTIQPVTRRTLLPWLHRKSVVSYQPTYATGCATGCSPTCTTACYPPSTGGCCPTYTSSTYGNTCAPSCGTGACSSLYQPTGIVRTIHTAPISSCPTGCTPITTIPQASAGATITTDPGYGSEPSTYKSERAGETNGSSDPTRPLPNSGLQNGPSLNGNPASIERHERSKWIEPENKTAKRPFRYASYLAPIERPAPISVSYTPQLDVGGWRASRD